MKNGVIISKLQSLEQALQALQSLGTVTADQLRGDWKTRRAIERELQIAVEIVIDVCQRLISLAGQSPAPTGADAVSRCVQLGVLSSVEPYRKMVQFRNFIVHHYEEVDLEILVDIVNHRLVDFERFRTEVLRYVQR
jgi:uncharacterized protein YutE (UPF0331/DUF86 family)